MVGREDLRASSKILEEHWDDTGKVNVGEVWEESVFRQAKEQYGVVDLGERDRITKRILDTVEKEKNNE